MNDERFINAGDLNKELKEIEKMFSKEDNSADATTITAICMGYATIVCC